MSEALDGRPGEEKAEVEARRGSVCIFIDEASAAVLGFGDARAAPISSSCLCSASDCALVRPSFRLVSCLAVSSRLVLRAPLSIRCRGRMSMCDAAVAVRW